MQLGSNRIERDPREFNPMQRDRIEFKGIQENSIESEKMQWMDLIESNETILETVSKMTQRVGHDNSSESRAVYSRGHFFHHGARRHYSSPIPPLSLA